MLSTPHDLHRAEYIPAAASSLVNDQLTSNSVPQSTNRSRQRYVRADSSPLIWGWRCPRPRIGLDPRTVLVLRRGKKGGIKVTPASGRDSQAKHPAWRKQAVTPNTSKARVRPRLSSLARMMLSMLKIASLISRRIIDSISLLDMGRWIWIPSPI